MSKIAKLQKQIKAAQARHNQAQGRVDGAMERLAEEHGCTTIAQAEKKLKQYTKRRDAAQAAYETAIGAFEDEHADTLAKLDDHG